jgi:hypothetical protein
MIFCGFCVFCGFLGGFVVFRWFFVKIGAFWCFLSVYLCADLSRTAPPARFLPPPTKTLPLPPPLTPPVAVAVAVALRSGSVLFYILFFKKSIVFLEIFIKKTRRKKKKK